MINYNPRVADALLKEYLSCMGAVLVRGAKWCGKTTTCEQVAKSVVYMDDPRTAAANQLLAQTNPAALLEGDTPRLIDEWQDAPTLWDTVRFAVDHGDGCGRYILTGSAVPPAVDEESKERQIHHTGTGRIARLTMRPMSLWESQESSGTCSIARLFAGDQQIGARAKGGYEELADLCCRGGWPASVGLTGHAALMPAREYVKAITETDISRVDNTLRDPVRALRLMRSLARLQGTQAKIPEIVADVAANDKDSINRDTVDSYLAALRKIFVTEDMPAWCPNLRCKTPIRTTETRFFTDPSMATAALGLSPGDLRANPIAYGYYFETMAVRDLRTYAEALGGTLYHYLDKGGLECDAVMHLDNGDYGLIEIKLGGEDLIKKGRTTLDNLVKKLDTTHMKSPSFRIIVVAEAPFVYPLENSDILVCPLSALRP